MSHVKLHQHRHVWNVRWENDSRKNVEMIVVSLLYLCSFCCDTPWVSGKGRRQKEAFSASLFFSQFSLAVAASEISTNQTQMRLLTANEFMTANTQTDTHAHTRCHMCTFIFSTLKKKPNKPLFPSPLCALNPQAMSVDTPSVYIYAHTHTRAHTADHDEWSPQGGADKERPLPPAILLSLALHTHSFIHFPFPPSGLSRAHILFLISSLTHSPAALNPFCISVLNSCSSFKHPLLINLLPRFFDSCAPVLLAPSEVLPNKKHLQSEIWTWTLNSGLVCLGEFSIRRATVYTGRCSHTQRHLPPYM